MPGSSVACRSHRCGGRPTGRLVAVAPEATRVRAARCPPQRSAGTPSPLGDRGRTPAKPPSEIAVCRQRKWGPDHCSRAPPLGRGRRGGSGRRCSPPWAEPDRSGGEAPTDAGRQSVSPSQYPSRRRPRSSRATRSLPQFVSPAPLPRSFYPQRSGRSARSRGRSAVGTQPRNCRRPGLAKLRPGSCDLSTRNLSGCPPAQNPTRILGGVAASVFLHSNVNRPPRQRRGSRWG